MFPRCLIAAGLLLAWNCGQAPQPDETPPLLVHGGVILTMDETAPEAEAMAVREGRIIAVGAEDELRARFPKSVNYDLKGRTVLPGIVDSHVHVCELGLDRLKADLTGVASVAEMIDRLRARYPEPSPGEWLIGQGWDEGVWASRGYPDRAKLDEAFPDNPVALASLHGFAGFYNGAALTRAGVDRETADPEGGRILRRDDGAPTGVMLALGQGLVDRHIPQADIEALKNAILEGLWTLAAAGVTSVHEAGMDAARVRAFRELAEAERLPIRVYGMLNGNDAALMDDWFARGPLIDGNAMFTVRAIKVFYDGSLGSRTALLAQPYADAPEEAAMVERISPETLRQLAERAATLGFQMAVHAIGDEANDRAMTLFETVMDRHHISDHRWRVEHAQVVPPDFFRRAANLGVIASMQPSHAVGDSKWAEDRLGPERIARAYAWRDFLGGRAPLILNSDLPGEPWEPRHTLYFAVTRMNLDGQPPGGWRPEQSLTVAEALRAMTAAGAHAAFQEDAIGRLTPGLFADFIELDRDPRSVAPAALKDLRVERVWLAGEPVVRPEAPAGQ